jgi:uncharacterized membrane protein
MKAIMNLVTRTLYILASCASFTATTQAFTLKYHVTAITPGVAQGVNDKGDVTGTLTVLSNPRPPVWDPEDTYTTHAFLYKVGKVLDLGVLFNPNNPDGEHTLGEAVNNSGVVVGDIVDAGPGDPSAGAFDAFLWKSGVFTDIAQGTTDGGSSADAVGINEQGTAVGTYDATVLLHKLKVPGLGLFGYPHAYISRNGVQTDLGTLAGQNGNYSSGFAINNAGQVVGVSTNTTTLLSGDSYTGGAPFYAFLWTNGTMKVIGGAQSSNFAPTAINDNGWIAGTLSSQVAGTYSAQAVFYINSRFISLGRVKGFPISQSLSMNDLGMVVGNLGSGAPSYTSSVFVYYGEMHDLNTLVDGGWTITTVGKINNFGQIAATGVKAGSTTTYALLLTPSL